MGKVLEVKSKKDLKKFIKFPFKLYGKTFRNWVPPILMELKQTLNRDKNPYFEYSKGSYFIFVENGKTLGRITVSINNRYIKKFKEKVGFFGFFECVNRQYVAKALFNTAASWLKKRGVKNMLGPFNFSTNEEGGLLLKGFDRPPMFMMTYNPEYYVDLYENYGLKKIKELWAWYVDIWTVNLPEKIKKFTEKTENRKNITIRKLNMKNLNDEVDIIQEIYNDAWENNWGFIPYTDREVKQLKDNLKLIAESELVFIAEVDGEPAGFIIGLRDINEIIIDMNGKLFPLGIIKLLIKKNRLKTMRVITLGVKKKFRSKGLGVVLYYKLIKSAMSVGIVASEMSWILDDNYMMNNILEKINATKYKRYGIYSKDL